MHDRNNSRTRGARRAAGWLRLSDLRPLDAILSRSPHFQSKISARLAGGEFSHAALVVDEHLWFDAQPAGCGTYSPTVDAVWGEDGWYLDLRSLVRPRFCGIQSLTFCPS